MGNSINIVLIWRWSNKVRNIGYWRILVSELFWPRSNKFTVNIIRKVTIHRSYCKIFYFNFFFNKWIQYSKTKIELDKLIAPFTSLNTRDVTSWHSVNNGSVFNTSVDLSRRWTLTILIEMINRLPHPVEHRASASLYF